MTALAAISTVGAVVGQMFGPVSWQHLQPALPARQQAGAVAQDYFAIQNESQCGFLVTKIGTGRTFRLAAGGWLAPTEATTHIGQDTGLSFQVEYVLTNPLVQQIGVDYFSPGEPLPQVRTLGNSPIGGSVSVLSTPIIIVEPTVVFPITTTGLTILGPFSIATTGLYEVTSSLLVSNGGGATITMQVSYTEGFTGTSVTGRSLSISSSTALNGVSLPNNGFGINSACFYVKGGTSLTVNFQDGTGTPNDQVVVGINKMF